MITRGRLRVALSLAVSGMALGISGCATGDAVIPFAIYESVNTDGREWTYDVSWQNTRALNEEVRVGRIGEVRDLALILASRMHRLETGEAGPLRDRRTANLLENLGTATQSRSVEENLSRLKAAAQELQDRFDAAEFAVAKELALEVLTISRVLLGENTNPVQ